jgi:hypothetical protein
MSDYTPQGIRNDILLLAKDQDRLLLALASIPDEENRKRLGDDIKSLLKISNPTKKKKVLNLKENNFIDDLIRNLNRYKNTTTIIQYTPTEEVIINKVNSLDLEKEKMKIVEIHSKVKSNEECANSLVLREAYYRGKFYYQLKTKFEKIEDFLTYCGVNLDVAQTTVYCYLGVMQLIDDYPGILLSGFGVTELYKNSKLLRKTVESDGELRKLMQKTYPGIKVNCNLGDPTIDLSILCDKMVMQ